MDDRTNASNLTVSSSEQSAYRGGSPLRQRFPTIAYLREHARHHIPHFAFEYCDGGAGSDKGIARNWSALDAVELVPRYGVMPSLPTCDVELFGRRYAAPIGIAPMGGPALVWPGADRFMAQAAQKARVPYVLGTVGGLTIEDAARLAPDVLWFQLYRMARNDHALAFDLMRRAEAAGVHVFVMTVDVPVRTTRPREVVVGLGGGRFSPDLRMIMDMLRSPGWLSALAREGHPRFANLKSYAGANAGTNEVIGFARDEIGGAFTWDASAGSVRSCSRASCTQPMPRAPSSSVSTASGSPITAAARSKRCRPRSMCCRQSQPRCAAAQPFFSTAACAAAPTWCARSRSALTRPLPARPSSGGSARLAPTAPVTSSICCVTRPAQRLARSAPIRSPTHARW